MPSGKVGRERMVGGILKKPRKLEPIYLTTYKITVLRDTLTTRIIDKNVLKFNVQTHKVRRKDAEASSATVRLLLRKNRVE
jgi:hypothetical protein